MHDSGVFFLLNVCWMCEHFLSLKLGRNLLNDHGFRNLDISQRIQNTNAYFSWEMKAKSSMLDDPTLSKIATQLRKLSNWTFINWKECPNFVVHQEMCHWKMFFL